MGEGASSLKVLPCEAGEYRRSRGGGYGQRMALNRRRARELRNRMTLPEVVLWCWLKDRQCAGLKFRRQHAMLEYILDFYCAEAKLCVEIDSRAHDSEAAATHDARRDQRLLAERGVLTLRFMAVDVLKGDCPHWVLEEIARVGRQRCPL